VTCHWRVAAMSHRGLSFSAVLLLVPCAALALGASHLRAQAQALPQSSILPPPVREPIATSRKELPSIRVTARAKRRGQVRKPGDGGAAPLPQSSPTPAATTSGGAFGAQPTPLNTNVIAASATRLGLTVRQTPASVEVVSQQTMQEQGYRTTTDTAQGAVGVLAGDSAGAPANFSMRGFAGPQVNVLYNGIWTGPADITSR